MGYESQRIINFIQSLSLQQYIASVLFENWNDCTLFLTLFHNKNRQPLDDLLDFREHKITNANKSLTEFVEDYNSNGLKVSFERTFYQYLDSGSVSLLEDAIASGKVSVEYLFNKFKENHNRNIMKYVL